MANKEGIIEEVEVPAGITVKVEKGIVEVKGTNGEVKKNMHHKKIEISAKGNIVNFASLWDNKNARKMIGTYKAHLRNMFKGVKEGHKYVMKICSGHFPMNVSASKNEFVVKNLLGEKIPRVLRLSPNVTVKVDGDFVNVESADKDIAGQCAASIEQLTKRPKFDTRIFQDGIYIINKDGKDVK